MSDDCPALGVFTKVLWVPGSDPYDWTGEDVVRYEILDEGGENLQKHGRIIGGQGITGKFYRLQSRKRFGGHFVYGRMSLNPSPGYLKTLLPFLVGSDTGGNGIFKPAKKLNLFGALLDRDLGAPWELQEGRVAQWELSSQGISFREQGVPDLLRLDIDIIFADETRDDGEEEPADLVWPDPEPELPYGSEFAPYIFQDCDDEVTLNGSKREIYQFKIRYSNELSIRYANSLRISSACATRRHLQVGFVLPWNAANEDLYGQSYEGAEGSIKFALPGGLHSTEFGFTNLTVPDLSPHTRDLTEIWFENNAEGYGDEVTDTAELTVTNVVTDDGPGGGGNGGDV